MKQTFTNLIKKSARILPLLAVILCASCNNTPANTGEKTDAGEQKRTVEQSQQVDCSAIMQYVNCPADTVRQMLAVGDSIFQMRSNLTIDMLGMGYPEQHEWMEKQYGDTIPLIVSLFASYDAITTRDSNVVNSVFVWHDVVNKQVASYMDKPLATREDVEQIFHTIDEILEDFGGGTQPDMNNAAWRWVMVADYRLVDAYKKLIDAYPEEDLVGPVQHSYQQVMDSYEYYCDHLTEHYSDLPRELGCLMADLMDDDRGDVEELTAKYLAKQIQPAEVRAFLENRTLNPSVKITGWDWEDE